MNQNNTGSRSPSRTRQSNNNGAPGVLAVSASMLANANQSQSGSAKSSGRRSKAPAQRATSGKTSRNSTSNRDSGVSAGEKAVEGMNGPSLASNPMQEASRSTPPTRRTRKAKTASATQEQDDSQSHFSAALASIVKSADAKGMQPSELETMQSNTPARRNSPVGSRRPQHRRGRSQNALQVQYNDEAGASSVEATARPTERDTLIPSHEELATLSMLSKSAPASSFLDAPQHSRRTRKQSQKGISNIANGTSADEWDMPRTATGSDALTWQQEVMSRKPPGNKQQYAKKPVQEQSSQHQSSGISAMAAAAKNTSSALPPSLTWQQELFRQNSNPSTPTDLFTALEDGHSGAHPMKDNRSRSSPTKSRSAKRAPGLVQTASYSDTPDLDRGSSSMVLAETTAAKKGKKANKNKQPASPSLIKPIAMAHSGSKSSTQRPTASDSDASVDEIGDLSFDESTTPTVPLQARPISISSSPTKATLYAGPKFHNSPSAGQLPTPRMAAFLSRNRDANRSPEVLAA